MTKPLKAAAKPDDVKAAWDLLGPPARMAVQLHCVDRQPVSTVAARLGADKAVAYRLINTSLTHLQELGIDIPDLRQWLASAVSAEVTMPDEPKPDEAKPSRKTVVPIERLVDVLAKEFGGRRVSAKGAEELLRATLGACSRARAIEARDAHNSNLDAALAKSLTKPLETQGGPNLDPLDEVAGRSHCRPEGVPTDTPSTKPPADPELAPVVDEAPSAGEVVESPVVVPSVAEVWLMGARPPISCMLVHTDETTGTRDLTAVSMLGAQREITGQLIADGYRPDGPWVDVDPAGPEAMRKFQHAEGSPS
ncbi:hypothetical protein [Dactylosporangium sp. CA-139066]|uniref:hypothetical protein n=1 Tax=Dactylosporangium sp. CA-139066 TaxID=3239930 RepID=UPI003D9174F3